MKDIKLNLNDTYKICTLLKNESIKKEIEDKLKGYSLSEQVKINDEFVYTLFNSSNDRIDLILSNLSIRLLKYSKNILERFTVNKYLLLEHQILENRPRGVIYTSIQKDFIHSKKYKNRYLLMDLMESRYVLTLNNLEMMFEDLKLDKYFSMQLLLKLRRLEYNNELRNYSDLITYFSTNLNYYLTSDISKEDLYSSRTYFNWEDISNLYDSLSGEDKIYRIYDLYHGIVNPRNEYDIRSIHLGNLSQDAFDLRTLHGITSKEDELVGKCSKKDNLEYLNYLKDLLKNRYGYKTNFELDRELILKAILHKKLKYNENIDENSKILIKNPLDSLKYILKK